MESTTLNVLQSRVHGLDHWFRVWQNAQLLIGSEPTADLEVVALYALFTRMWRQRLVAGSALAILAIAVVNLMHFSQGWVQFGYRFSNDFAPFAIILVGLALARYGVRWWTVGLVALSIVINAWGVYMGVAQGW